VTAEPRPETGPGLFFVNLGGYDPAEVDEMHRNVLIVEKDANAAKARALRSVRAWGQPHRDKLLEVETKIEVGSLAARSERYLQLAKSLTDAEVSALVTSEFASPLLRDAMIILALTGMRIEELARMKMGDLLDLYGKIP
jgi:integrase